MPSTSSLELSQSLIRFPSVSNTSNVAIIEWLADRLSTAGFAVERSDYLDDEGVAKANLIARRDPLGPRRQAAGGLAYFAHVDVVPAVRWSGPSNCGPFEPTVVDGRLFGRGSCDMKGSLACFLAATAQTSATTQAAPLWLTCTADEETGFEGARQLVTHSSAYRELVAAQPLAIVGEPTMLQVVHAHKGIRGLEFTSRGRAAHSSTRLGLNANLAMVPLLDKLRELHFRCESDPALRDLDFDPPTLSWNFGVSDGGTAHNITPGICHAWVSMRPMIDCDGEALLAEAAATARELGIEVERYRGCGPVWVEPDRPSVRSMCELAGQTTPRTVSYATDGGQFSELKDLVVIGPGDIAQAHTADEFICLDQLAAGTELYRRAIEHYCGPQPHG
jgi:acetylornithine deacetylase